MSVSADISLPKIYHPLIDLTDSTGVIHAPINCRVTEVFVALAVADALKGKSVVFVSRRYARIKSLLSSWLTSKVRRDVSIEVLPPGSLDEIERPSSHVVYATDCHEIQTDLTRVYPTQRLVLAGLFADRNSWFYQYSQSTRCLYLDADIIRKAFPDQASRGLDESDPYYERLMSLVDADPEFHEESLDEFAPKRLKIKTDKPGFRLSSTQQEEARGQYGTPIVSFHLNSIQVEYIKAQKKAIEEGKKPWFILLKYRRGGFTTLEQGRSYQICATRPHSICLTLAHTLTATQRIFSIAGLMAQRDPAGLQINNEAKSHLEFLNGSSFFIGTAGAKGFARGDTLQRVHGSEVAKWCSDRKNQISVVNDLVAGLLGAASNGTVILESTPNGREWFCQQYEEAKAGLSEFTPIFIPWFKDPVNRLDHYDADEIRDTITADELALIEKFHLDFAQIAFRREQKRVYKALFPQEMPEDDVSCFLTSGLCYFDVESLLNLLTEIKSEVPLSSSHVPGGREIRWANPEPKVEYCMGVDCSEGLPGCDRSGVGIIRRDTGEQVLSLHGIFSPSVLAQHVIRLATEYNGALTGVEQENHGHAVLQKIRETGNHGRPHFRGGWLYYHTKRSDPKSSKPGWTTTELTRPIMLSSLAEAIESRSMLVRDETMIHECLSFRKQTNGRFEADSGAYDDSVIKWAIAWQMRNHRRVKLKITVR